MKSVDFIHGKMIDFQNKLINHCMELLKRAKKYSEYDPEYKIDKYKLSTVLFNIYKLMILIFIFKTLRILKYCMVIMIVYGFFRKTTMGVHLNNNFLCILSDLLINSSGVYLCLYLNTYLSGFNFYNNIIFIIITISCLTALIAFIKYAPAITKKSQIKEKRKSRLKKYSYIYLGIFFLINLIVFFLFDFHLYILLMVYGLLEQIINILPCTFIIINKIEKTEEKKI